MTELPWETLRALVAAHPEEHLFVVVAGAHLYGSPSPESDVDLRGCHRLPTPAFFRLDRPSETVERLEVAAGEGPEPGREVETVSHEVEKLLRLLLKRNGAILELIHSPLVLYETPALPELRELARGCVTRGVYHHYVGVMQTLWREYHRQGKREVKPLLALYRAAMTSTHLLRTGEVECSLRRLAEWFQAPQVEELLARKAEGEGATVVEDMPYLAEIARLGARMEAAFGESTLPEAPTNREALDDFLYRQRWEGLKGGAGRWAPGAWWKGVG
jgi:predicted nucleotidyltransferase